MREIKWNLENPFFIVSSSLIFSSSWMILSFTFPIIGNSYNFGYLFTGLLGALTSIPFIVIGYIYRNSNRKMINFGLKAPFLVLAVLSFILSINQDIYFLMPVVVIGGIIQSFFWISSEIEINLLGKKGHAELYSAAWGIPAGVLPAVIGTILQVTGYATIFIFIGCLFLIGFFIQPIERYERPVKNTKGIQILNIIPMLFVGIMAGFTFFVLIPLLLNNSVPLYRIGIIISLWGISFAAGSLFLNFFHMVDMRKWGIITCLFVSLPVIWFINFNIYSVIFVLIIGGLGVSIGFSKILSYISMTSSPRNGVFYYESLFAAGFITGSLAGSSLYLYFSLTGILILFSMPVFFSLFLLLQNSSSFSTS